MNGLVHAATLGTPSEGKWGTFGGPRAFTKWIQSEPTSNASPPKTVVPPDQQATGATSMPPGTGGRKLTGKKLAVRRQSHLPQRPNHAMSGSQFINSLERSSLDDREAAILREITSGNFPDFLRNFRLVPIQNGSTTGRQEKAAQLEVMPDYLAIGSDADFVRMPMTPQTAQQIADRFDCILPTRKIVDAIDRFAEAHLAPHPMTKDRETIATFAEHNRIIENQRGDTPLGLLLIGIKKDIVLTPRIFETPQRLAIYGWRQLDGRPIQPLTTAHFNGYVDYSHGARLVRDRVVCDRKRTVTISKLLADPELCGLVSDEGPMKPPRYPRK
jgi:hypothetical protein